MPFGAIKVRDDYEFFQDGSKLEAAPGAVVVGLVKAARQGAVLGSATLARGEVTLDGSNPTSVTAATTGLSGIAAACVTLKQTTAPGDDPSWLTCDYNASSGQLDIYAWKNTGGTDPTLVASTNSAAVVSWIAIGDPV